MSSATAAAARAAPQKNNRTGTTLQQIDRASSQMEKVTLEVGVANSTCCQARQTTPPAASIWVKKQQAE